MGLQKLKGNGEQTQWLVSNVVTIPNNVYVSALSKIKRLSQTSKAGHQAVIALFFWVPTDLELEGQANRYWNIPWDPEGYSLYTSSSEKRWTTLLNCYEQLMWSSILLAGAFRIWLVAWNVDGLVFSMGSGHAPFQRGREVDMICSNLMYYHDCQDDSSKTEEIHMPASQPLQILQSFGLGTSRVSRREGC
jgi:hypothetical protein